MPNSDTQSTALLSSSPDRASDTDLLPMMQAIAQAVADRKGGDLTVLHAGPVSTLADYFVIVTGLSKAQVRAISDSIADRVEKDFQRLPSHLEGQADGTWVLMDYGDVIVHVQMPQEREFYNLEAFWGHAEKIEMAPIT